MDTQWPRWEVFKQDRPDKPHEAVGTVHAPDAEVAMLSARDVFVRRPECHNLWVAPEAAVQKLTAQERAAHAEQPDQPAGDEGGAVLYQVFCRHGHRRSMAAVTHIGQVSATSPAEAMRLATRRFTTEDTVMWWVVAEDAITRSGDDDAASMFEPARDKTYRDQTSYRGRIFEGRRRGGTVKKVPDS